MPCDSTSFLGPPELYRTTSIPSCKWWAFCLDPQKVIKSIFFKACALIVLYKLQEGKNSPNLTIGNRETKEQLYNSQKIAPFLRIKGIKQLPPGNFVVMLYNIEVPCSIDNHVIPLFSD